MDNRQRQKRNKAQQFYDHILSARIGAILEKHIKMTKNILVCTNPKAHQGKQECARRARTDRGQCKTKKFAIGGKVNFSLLVYIDPLLAKLRYQKKLTA